LKPSWQTTARSRRAAFFEISAEDTDHPACYSCCVANPNPDSLATQAQTLSIPARLLLFCVASRTEWERAGITRATVTTMVIRGLIERDVAGGLTITSQGRAVLAALLMAEDE
jgi:hypothetical protein